MKASDLETPVLCKGPLKNQISGFQTKGGGGMPVQTIQKFQIKKLSLLDSEGALSRSATPSPWNATQLKEMFQKMIFTREFDRRCLALQRQGRMGTFASSLGQEAISVGSALAMSSQDWAAPSFREQGLYLSRGIPAHLLLLFFMGNEEGNRLPKEKKILPYCIPCASQTLHAVGLALGATLKEEPGAVLTYLGDGATSEGDFHEAMNMASIFQLPVIFICQNNQWAISTPVSRQFHGKHLAQRALAYGMPGIQVDGNDVLAVYQATQQALSLAKAGQGPSFLECLTYRMEAHTTSDDPSRYRDTKEQDFWKSLDPIDRFEKYLIRQGLLQNGDRKKIENECSELLKQEIATAEAINQRLNPDEMFAYLYAHFPETLRPQRVELSETSAPLKQKEQSHG